jgi:formylglycine-generating enzyme required for sulfatase activity
MTYVQGGSFTMGHDGDVANERPAHAATVEAFCVDAREVTWSDYQSCVRRGESNGCTANNEAWWENADAPSQRRQTELCAATSDPQRPAACVTWDMAQRYCQIRGGDLPTEAQWEFAARGSDGRAFPWGNEPPTATRMNGCGLECYAYWFPGQRAGAGDVLFADDDGAAVAVDVSRFTEDRSAAGVFGMGGNVSEWVRDCEGAYGAGEHPAEGATCRGTQPRRVARGGSWNSADAASVRATARTFLSAATQRVDLGFRCVTAPR